jgi:hypothetical protein
VNAFCAPNSFRGKRSISILSRPPPPYKCVCVCEWSSGRVFCSVPPSSLSLLIDYTVLLLSLLISLPFLLRKKKTISTAVLLFASSSFSLRRSHPSSQAAIRCYCVFSVVIIDLFHNKRKS